MFPTKGQQGATGCNQRHLCEGVSWAAKIAPGAPVTGRRGQLLSLLSISTCLTVERVNTSNHIGARIYLANHFIDILGWLL